MLYITLLFATILIILVNCRIVGGGYNDEYLSTDTTKKEKGIAAILIVLHHLSQRVKVSGPFVILGYIGFILVAVFFFISGYGLSYGAQYKHDYFKGFFRKRLFPVLVPYWIVNTIYIVFDLIKGTVFTPMEYVLSFVGVGTITGTWFVTSILIMYIIFWIAFISKKSYSILGLCLIGYCIICFNLNLHSSYTASIAAFALGVLWNKIDRRTISWIRERYYLKLLIILGTFGMMFFGRLVLSAKGFNNVILQMILRNFISVLFIFVLVAVTQTVQFTGKTLEWLGNISYELYLVHGMLLSMLSGLNPNVYMVAVLGGGLLLSTLLWKIDKRLIKRIIIRNNWNAKEE